MELIIILLIGLINIFAVYMVTKFLKGVDQTSQLRFILIGVGIVYIVTSILFKVASSSFNIEQDISNFNNMVIFSMVPINVIVFLPYIAKIYTKKRDNKLSYLQLKKRYIILGILIFLVIIFEYLYLKNSVSMMVNYLK